MKSGLPPLEPLKIKSVPLGRDGVCVGELDLGVDGPLSDEGVAAGFLRLGGERVGDLADRAGRQALGVDRAVLVELEEEGFERWDMGAVVGFDRGAEAEGDGGFGVLGQRLGADAAVGDDGQIAGLDRGGGGAGNDGDEDD